MRPPVRSRSGPPSTQQHRFLSAILAFRNVEASPSTFMDRHEKRASLNGRYVPQVKVIHTSSIELLSKKMVSGGLVDPEMAAGKAMFDNAPVSRFPIAGF